MLQRHAHGGVGARESAEQEARRQPQRDRHDRRDAVVLVAILVQRQPRARRIAIDQAGIRQVDAETGIARGYMCDSNDWFQKVLEVEPRWNRMVAYPGTVMHSGDIRAPQLLSGDPRRGRLTINGFFACTRALSAAA